MWRGDISYAGITFKKLNSSTFCVSHIHSLSLSPFLLQLSKTQKLMGDLLLARKTMFYAIDIFKSLHSLKNAADCFEQLADWYYKENVDIANKYYEESRKLHVQLGDSSSAVSNMRMQSNAAFESDADRSNQLLLTALFAAHTMEDYQELALCLRQLARRQLIKDKNVDLSSINSLGEDAESLISILSENPLQNLRKSIELLDQAGLVLKSKGDLKINLKHRCDTRVMLGVEIVQKVLFDQSKWDAAVSSGKQEDTDAEQRLLDEAITLFKNGRGIMESEGEISLLFLQNIAQMFKLLSLLSNMIIDIQIISRRRILTAFSEIYSIITGWQMY
jgi:hypothetical protein